MPNDTVPQAERPGLMTWMGVFIALFGLFLIRQAIRTVSHDPGTALVIVREVLIFASAGALLVLVKRGEKLPLKTVGLGTSVWWKSVLWGFVTMLLCGGAAELLGMVIKNGGGSTSPLDRLPLWVCVLIVFRAGVVEELFYRGYAIERLRAMGVGRFASAALPLLYSPSVTTWEPGSTSCSRWRWAAFSQGSIFGGETWWPTSLPTSSWTWWALVLSFGY